MTTAPIRIGTRGSALALWQANHIADRLRTVTDRPVELVTIQTQGDQVQTVPLGQLGGLGAFTKAIQDALTAKTVDVAVHSLKDLPTFAVPGLVLAAVPERGPSGDAFVSTRYRRFADLPGGASVATSSVRRRAQLRHHRGDLNLAEIRGNVDTRLRKLAEQNLDGLILAEAGLERLGLGDRITEVLPTEWMLPAVGQGALGLECRADDPVRELLGRLNDPATFRAVTAERALLRGLGGGCEVPVGALAMVTDGVLRLRAAVLSPDGARRVAGEITGAAEEADRLGRDLAERLMADGAAALLRTDT